MFSSMHTVFLFKSGVLKNIAIFNYIMVVILDVIMINGSRSCQSHVSSQICLIS